MSRDRRPAAPPAVGRLRIRPHWLERQLDPRSAAFVAGGDLGVAGNVTSRNWTVVGTVSSPRKAAVDPRGLLTPWPGAWSLDWWIGAEDRWHFPSREAAVRQQLVAGTPVVETAMRIPGGDAVHRVYAVPGPDGPLAVVEITNRTPTPFAVALALRPYHPIGFASVGAVGLDDTTVTVDGRPVLLLPKRPQRVAATSGAVGDVADVVTSGRAGAELPPHAPTEDRGTTAAFLFPLAHTATLRVAVPLEPEAPRSRAGRARQRGLPPRLPSPLPDSDAAVRAWQAQTSRGMRLVLPEGRLAEAVEATRRSLLLFHDGFEVAARPFAADGFRFRDAVILLAAMDRYGFHGETAEVVAALAERQGADGSFREDDGADATGAALHAIAEHRSLTGPLEAVSAEAVARALRSIERRHRGAATVADGLDGLWAIRGLLDGAALLRALGEDRAAGEVEASAAARRTALDASLGSVAARAASAGAGASGGSRGGVDHTVVAVLTAAGSLRLLPPDHEAVVATLDDIREASCLGAAVVDGLRHAGLDPALTIELAAVELASGDRRCLERLAWMVEAASPTFAWPSAVHPTLGGGSGGEGHDGAVAAAFLSFVRDLLVREVGEDELALCSMLPDAWSGQPIEVHDAPSRHGSISYAIRWHGDRPALLWDLRPRDDRGVTVRITVPGLDPAWSSTERKGEALLAAPVAPRPPEPAPEGSFS